MSAPRYRLVRPGQVWRVQRNSSSTVTHPVLVAVVDEVTPGTVLLRWLDDGSIEIRPDAPVIRYARNDFRWIEQVPG